MKRPRSRFGSAGVFLEGAIAPCNLLPAGDPSGSPAGVASEQAQGDRRAHRGIGSSRPR